MSQDEPRRSGSRPSLRGILDLVVQHLEYERERGCVSVEASPATVKELGTASKSGGIRNAPAPSPAAMRSASGPAAVPQTVSANAVAAEGKPLGEGAGASPATPTFAGPAAGAPSSRGESAEERLARIEEAVRLCRKCDLHRERQKTVPGQGPSHPELMFVGEGPGLDEDRQGLAFVGAAGELLTRMIQAMGFAREQVFIANVVKCRPPGNRQPLPEESDACMPYLKEQIEILKPKVIVALGGVAAKNLLGVDTGITQLRGTWALYDGRIDVMPTFHPSYLLRDPSHKVPVWEDLKAVVRRLGRQIPKR